MKLFLKILLFLLLTGCPKVPEKPKDPTKEDPKKTEAPQEDPFDLSGLIEKPLESLPAGFLDSTHIVGVWRETPADIYVSPQSLEGVWYGGIRDHSSYSIDKSNRAYLQFRSDNSFSYGCINNSPLVTNHPTYGTVFRRIKKLIDGKYSIINGHLFFQPAPLYDNETLKSFFKECYSDSWQEAILEQGIPVRQSNQNTLIFFDQVNKGQLFSDKSNASVAVFLVRKPEVSDPPVVSSDPFNLETLFGEPFAELPEAMPKTGSNIVVSDPSDLRPSYENLEGVWYGGVYFRNYHNKLVANQARRIYLKLTNDRRFSYGCIVKERSAGTLLLSGKYWIENNVLFLQLSSGDPDDKRAEYCLGNWNLNFELKIPTRLVSANALILFNAASWLGDLNNEITPRVFLQKE